MKKVLGLDLGSRTCGIAMSDIIGMIAHGVETFRFKPDDYLTCAKHVKEIVEKSAGFLTQTNQFPMLVHRLCESIQDFLLHQEISDENFLSTTLFKNTTGYAVDSTCHNL